MKTADISLAQYVGRCIRCADPTVLEIRDTSVEEPNPQAVLRGVGGENRSRILAYQPIPGDTFYNSPANDMKETNILVADPEAPGTVTGDGIKFPTRHFA